MTENLGFDIFILILRIALVFLLYFFLFLVVRTITRELSRPARRSAAPAYASETPYPPEDYTQRPRNPAEPSGRLVVTESGNARTVQPGVVFELGPINPIGRRSDNAIILDDDFVSSEHSLLAWREGRWWLSDVASTNGTFLNGQPITQPVPVAWGDLIGVGRVRLRLEP